MPKEPKKKKQGTPRKQPQAAKPPGRPKGSKTRGKKASNIEDTEAELSPVEEYVDAHVDEDVQNSPTRKKSPRKQPQPHKTVCQGSDSETDRGDPSQLTHTPTATPSSSSSRSRPPPKARAEFDDNTEQELLDFIESYPVLWQATHREHSNVDKRNQVWELAEKQFGRPGE
jgi:hypothetical protein